MRIRHTYLLAIWLMLVGLLVCPTRAGCAVRDTGESITWWIHVTDSSNFKMISERPTERGWSYHDYSNVEGKLVNRIRLNVARAGTLSLRIKKVDGTIVDKETIHLSNPTTNPTLATMQVIEITPFVLAAGEVIIFGDVDDTGRFCFQAGSLPTPNFSIPVAGNVPYSNNLSIDIGYSPEPQYTLTVAANDKTMGRVTPSGGGKYFDNESVIVEATPEVGYTFFCWSDDNKDNPRTLTITQDTELTAIFQEDITWYVHATASSVFDMLSDGGSGWAYRTVEAEACYNKIINRIRLNVAEAGTFMIGKTDGMTYTRLQTIYLQHPTTSPKQATLQVYPIHPVTLGANERLVLGQPDDTGHFNHHRNTSHKPEGLFDGGITSSRPSGQSTSPNNLSIDIGWYPEPQYTLTVAANDETMGSVTPSVGKYFANESIIVEATPEPGYTFFCWSDDNKDNPRTLTITQDTELTAIFQEDVEWYVHVTDQSTLDRVSYTPHAGWMYDKNAAEAPACYGKTINRLRLNVAQAGTFTIGKTDGTTYTPLQTLELTNATTNPSQATLQIYAIQPITLGDNERLVFGQPSDTGKFYYGMGAEGVFIHRVSTILPAGADYNNLNLSIDIGWYPFPILDIYHHDDAPNAEVCTQVDATTIAQLIRYYRKFSPGKWETLCLPFNVERITVYDPDDNQEYNLHAQYLYNGVRQAGDFWLYAFHEDVVGLQDFQPNWHEIEATCPAEALPKKNVPYIMMMPAGDYYQDKYVVFHSKREAIALTPFAPICPTADNQFTYQSNTTLMPQTISHAYLLNTTTDYFVVQEAAVLYPFECAVFATQATTRRLPRLSFTEQDDVTTSIPLPNQADGEAMLFTITGMYIGRYATESELTERIHALPQGWYIIKRNTAVQKIWRADE